MRVRNHQREWTNTTESAKSYKRKATEGVCRLNFMAGLDAPAPQGLEMTELTKSYMLRLEDLGNVTKRYQPCKNSSITKLFSRLEEARSQNKRVK